MEEAEIQTEGVVVTAIGLEREKKSIGYSLEEVGGKDISDSRTVNLLNAITGKVAGVEVISSAGTPGAAAFIRIRGTSSITGQNQPLFVIDGIPIDNSMDYSGNPDDVSNNLLDGVAYSNRAIDINPDDVESISVLKGAAATALYGLRAASGAIIITTKKGASAVGAAVNVSFTSTVGINEVNKLPEMQNKYAQGNSSVIMQPGTLSPNISWGPSVDTLWWDGGTYQFDKHGKIVGQSDANRKTKFTPYDNVKDFFQTGTDYTQSLNMAGGTEWGSYYFSFSNAANNGIVPKSFFSKTTLRLSGDAKISSHLKASGSASYMNSGGRRIQQGSNTSGVMLGLLRTPISFDNSNGFGADAVDEPSAYMFANGNQRTYRGETGDGKARYDNPFWTVNKNPFLDNVERFIGYFQFNYYVAEWMDIMYRLGADIYSDVRKQEFAIGSNAFPSGQVANHEINNSDINSDLILNFNYKLSDDLLAKLIVGNNLFQTTYQYLYTQGDGLVIPNFYHMSNTEGQIVRQSKQTLRRMAFYGDLTFDYASMVYLDATLRNELSTTLPEKNNSFMYYSINLSFIFTEAFKDVFKDSFLSFGKARFSYAVVGKDAPIYSTLTQYYSAAYADGWTNGISYPFNGYVGYAYGDVLGNDQLKPEKTSTIEAGINLSFFNSLITIDYTFYKSLSTDQIFNVPVASTSGFWRQVMNAGEISNTGHEIILTATPISNEDLKWDVALNWSTNSNMVEKLAEGIDNIFIGGFQGASIRAVAGKPYGTIFGHGWLRDANGNIVINDDPQSEEYGYPILDGNEKEFGSSNPDWLMGFRSSLSYAGLTFSFLIDTKQGGVMWNGTKGALYYFGTHKDTEIRGTTKVFKGVKGHYDDKGDPVISTQPNDVEVPLDYKWFVLGNGNGFGNNTEDFIEDAGWIRLREVSLSYDLPKTIVDFTPFAGIVVTFTGRNLWLSTDYTGVDPETNLMGAFNAQGIDYFNMPGIRSYIFSLNVKF